MTALENYIKSLNRTHLWEVNTSCLGGRGIFATHDLAADVEICLEPALVLGPRADSRCLQVCVRCHNPGSLVPCPGACGFSICSGSCPQTCDHRECTFLSNLGPMSFNAKLALIAPLRAIYLSSVQREILVNLEGHARDNHDILLSLLKSSLQEEDFSIVRICLQVFDATAYEIPTKNGGSVRGIYPVSALMNHECSPNTRHWFDSDGNMIVMTTRDVAAGEELTTSYTSLTWGTLIRRMHLQKTKRFNCQCKRCLDPTEFGSRLMALYCMKKGCDGVILPCDNFSSWSCKSCGSKLPAARISAAQEMVSKTVSGLSEKKLAVRLRMLLKRSLVPSCNEHAVELKLSLVRMLGHSTGFTWPELSTEELTLKKVLCTELIILLKVLRLGTCSTSAELVQELSATSLELSRRMGNF